MLVRGGVWTIASIAPHADCASLLVIPSRGTGPALTVLVPFDRPSRIATRGTGRFVRPRRWLHAMRRAACRAHGFGTLADPPATAPDLLPYQLEPALAMLRQGATRVLIADAVGLGKTIQSGFLLHTLASRDPSLRALVVVPAGLRHQWAGELESRFGLSPVLSDAAWLRRAARALPPDIAPWALPGIFIVSFDFLKRPEVLRPLEDLTWDLLIVDEAHNASARTSRRAAVDAAGVRAARVLLLTATPHAGDAAQFEALCSIGAASASERLVIFRRTHADAGLRSRRRSVFLAVRPSTAERAMHRLLDRYTAAICRDSARLPDGQSRLMAVLLKKRALSSAASLGVSVRRRLDLLTGAPAAAQLPLPLDDEDPLVDEADDSVLAAPGLRDGGAERTLLNRIARAADAAGAESKLTFLLRLVRRLREPAIVFTEYRDTLARLHAPLAAAGHAVTLLHGGQLPAERVAAQQRFNGTGGVLLATDAASEGLNLHSRCRVVIHYELPWTPSRLEQRAGRVDRIGQRARVHELLLVAGDPAERLVLAPLARRAARARSALGPSGNVLDHLTEATVGECVLSHRSHRSHRSDDHGSDDHRSHRSHRSDSHGLHGSRQAIDTPPGSKSVLAVIDLGAEAAAEAARLGEERRWRARSGGSRARREPGVVVTRVRRRTAHPPAAIYRLSLASAAGRIEHQALFAVRNGDGLSDADVLARLAAHIESVRGLYGGVQRALSDRAAALRARLSPSSQSLVQAGLFDRRAILARLERLRAAERLTDGLGGEDGSDDRFSLEPALALVGRLLG